MSSSFFSTAWKSEQDCLVSVGRYALRGVNRPQELFTLDPSVMEQDGGEGTPGSETKLEG